MGKNMLGAAVVATLLVAGCTSNTEPPQAERPTVFGPLSYGKLSVDMTVDAALATGALAPAPTSHLDGCTDYSYTGGPAPDAERMAAEEAAEKTAAEKDKLADEANAKADATKPGPNAGAKEYADSAEALAKATQAIADSAEAYVAVAAAREARDKAFGTAGGASFGTTGLVSLAAPAGVKTAEGIGQGSTVDEVKAAYGARGMTEDNGRFQVPIPEKSGWTYQFTAAGGKIVSVMILNPNLKCAG